MAEDSTTPLMAFYRSQKRINLAEFSLDDIVLEDVAHNLSQANRFAGNTARPYSVAEHSLLVMSMVENMGGTPVQIMQGLVHDSPEYITGDIVAPVKQLVPEVRKFEKEVIWPPLAEFFGVPLEMDPLVKKADWISLFVEAGCLSDRTLTDWERADEFIPLAEEWIGIAGTIPRNTMPHPQEVQKAFVRAYQVLKGAMEEEAA